MGVFPRSSLPALWAWGAWQLLQRVLPWWLRRPHWCVLHWQLHMNQCAAYAANSEIHSSVAWVLDVGHFPDLSMLVLSQTDGSTDNCIQRPEIGITAHATRELQATHLIGGRVWH